METTKEGWDDMLKAAKAKSGPQPNGGAGVKQGTRYGGSKSKMDAPAPVKGPSVAQLRSLKKDMKKESAEHIEENWLKAVQHRSDAKRNLELAKSVSKDSNDYKHYMHKYHSSMVKHIQQAHAAGKYGSKAEASADIKDHTQKAKQYKSGGSVHEKVEHIEEDMKSAAKEMHGYASKHGGIDKADFHKAAKHMEAGNHKALHNLIKNLDSDPRDKILTTLHKHGNDIKRYGYSTEEVVKEAHGDCNKCGKPESKCKCDMDEALVGNQHKLDKNKNGRLDKDDFKKLRGEEKDIVTMNPKMKTNKSAGSTTESMKSADKEAEAYTDSKGKTKYRMVSKDKNMKVESKIRSSLKSVLENKQTAGAVPAQPMNDSNALSGAGAKKMKKDHEPVIPKSADEPALEKDNFTAATKDVKKAAMRPNDNAKGDKNIINPVDDVTKKASKKEDDGFKQGGAPKLATSESFIDKISEIYKSMFKK